MSSVVYVQLHYVHCCEKHFFTGKPAASSRGQKKRVVSKISTHNLSHMTHLHLHY